MTYLGLTIITSRSNLDLLAYGGAGAFRKTSISKRTDIINNLGTSSLGHEVPISFQKRHLFFFYYFRFTFLTLFASKVNQRKPLCHLYQYLGQ